MMERRGKRRARAALVETRGNMTAAAKLIGCTRQNVWDMVNRHPDLRQLCEELLEESKDNWEEKLEEIGMKQNNPTALLGLLNAHARDRGYARHATDLNITGELQHNHNFNLHLHSDRLRELHALTDEDLAALLDQTRREILGDDSAPPLLTVYPTDKGGLPTPVVV